MKSEKFEPTGDCEKSLTERRDFFRHCLALAGIGITGGLGKLGKNRRRRARDFGRAAAYGPRFLLIALLKIIHVPSAAMLCQ